MVYIKLDYMQTRLLLAPDGILFVTSPLTEPQQLQATPGDVLISGEAIPYPGAILQGFHRSKYGPHIQPYLSFRELQNFLEFLEHVVLCERLISPVPRYTKGSERLVNGKRTWLDFATFRAVGDLDFTTERLGDMLIDAGILISAEVHVGDPTSDDVVARLMSSSAALQRKFSYFLQNATVSKSHDRFAIAQAHMAARIGTPLHMAEAACLVRVPYILGSHQTQDLAEYESELLRARRTVTGVLLERLNAGARKEIAKLAELGPVCVFPETPIASLIVQNATTPEGLVNAALQLRSEFADFRRKMNQIEADLANDGQSMKARLKRAQELERLANSLWKHKATDFRTNALSVSEALLAVPQVVSAPSLGSIKDLALKLTALPVGSILDIYRRRKIRLLLKAKRGFMRSQNSTKKIAQIFGIPEEVVIRSRHLKRAPLESKYATANPEIAATWDEQV